MRISFKSITALTLLFSVLFLAACAAVPTAAETETTAEITEKETEPATQTETETGAETETSSSAFRPFSSVRITAGESCPNNWDSMAAGWEGFMGA